MSNDTMRREDFIEALQSDELRVVVGESKKVFFVPKDLLAKCSSELDLMCIGEDEINLPDVDPSTFVDLAIFAKKYEVSVLLLQCLHVLKETWGFLKDKRGTSQKWTVKRSEAASPRVIRRIFENTEDTSVLRDMCASFLGGYFSSKKWCPVSTDEYKPVFEKFPQLGWRVFKNQMQHRDGKWPGIIWDSHNVDGREDEAGLARATESVDLGWKNWMEMQAKLESKQDESKNGYADWGCPSKLEDDEING